MAAAGSLPFGGILTEPSVYRTALMSKLSSGLPGTTAAPVSPPLHSVATVEQQPAPQLLRIGGVALGAMRDEQRSDFLLEEFDPGIVRVSST